MHNFVNAMVTAFEAIDKGNVHFNCGGCKRVKEDFTCSTYPVPKNIMEWSTLSREERIGKTIRGCSFNTNLINATNTGKKKKSFNPLKASKRKARG